MRKRKQRLNKQNSTSPSQDVQDEVNPHSLATSIRQEAWKVIDDLLFDDDHRRRNFTNKIWLESLRAKTLGRASHNYVYGRDLREVVIDPAVEHAGLEAALVALDPLRTLQEDILEAQTRNLDDLKILSEATLPKSRKNLAVVIKGLCVIGDDAIVATALIRNGTSAPLAFLVGLALATLVLAGGTWAGSVTATVLQRRARGSAPEGTPPALLPYYDNSKLTEVRLALAGCAFVALAMWTAIFLQGVGGGDSALMSAGAGLLGAFTVFGSLAAEGMTANALADAKADLRQDIARSVDVLEAIANLEAASASSKTKAALEEAAARHLATGTELTVEMLADRSFDNPEIRDYLTDQELPPAIEPPPHLHMDTSTSPRNTRRRRLSLHDKNATPAKESTDYDELEQLDDELLDLLDEDMTEAANSEDLS